MTSTKVCLWVKNMLYVAVTITSIFAGGLRGFTNIGDINTYLLEFERSLDDSSVEPP